jgi:hypothetical protein
MPTTKTFARQYLTPGAAPLPPVSEAATVGRALVESLCRAAGYRHALRLNRIGNGLFGVRFYYQNGGPETARDRAGGLAEVLASPRTSILNDRMRPLFGIPQIIEQPLVGELLIRLYERAESADVWVAFEYLPWIETHLRYRLRLGVRHSGLTIHPDFFIHGSSPEKLLIAGLAFFASQPTARP